MTPPAAGTTAGRPGGNGFDLGFDRIVVFSHLRWRFVHQRPQHLMTRLGREVDVLFVEEPAPATDGVERLERFEPCPGVTVLRPLTDVARQGFHDEQVPALRRLLGADLASPARTLAWFYTPMALPLLDELDEPLVAYDCMDELAAFRFAPPQLVQREDALFARADIVFTGGPSLQRAKQGRHRAVHCFPSSVDHAHFDPSVPRTDPAPQRALPRPRLGWSGVVDERFDTALVARIAESRRDWQFVFVGPVAKIDPASLPRGPNLHWFGQRPYEELPDWMAHWDVCLQPFAHNEATRFISPTKTLEYLAAGRPVVSTSISDVVEPWGHVVRIADGPEAFVEACAALLAESAHQCRTRQAVTRAAIAPHDWDSTVAAMADLLRATARRRKPLSLTGPRAECAPAPRAAFGPRFGAALLRAIGPRSAGRLR